MSPKCVLRLSPMPFPMVCTVLYLLVSMLLASVTVTPLSWTTLGVHAASSSTTVTPSPDEPVPAEAAAAAAVTEWMTNSQFHTVLAMDAHTAADASTEMTRSSSRWPRRVGASFVFKDRFQRDVATNKEYQQLVVLARSRSHLHFPHVTSSTTGSSTEFEWHTLATNSTVSYEQVFMEQAARYEAAVAWIGGLPDTSKYSHDDNSDKSDEPSPTKSSLRNDVHMNNDTNVDSSADSAISSTFNHEGFTLETYRAILSEHSRPLNADENLESIDCVMFNLTHQFVHLQVKSLQHAIEDYYNDTILQLPTDIRCQWQWQSANHANADHLSNTFRNVSVLRVLNAQVINSSILQLQTVQANFTDLFLHLNLTIIRPDDTALPTYTGSLNTTKHLMGQDRIQRIRSMQVKNRHHITSLVGLTYESPAMFESFTDTDQVQLTISATSTFEFNGFVNLKLYRFNPNPAVVDDLIMNLGSSTTTAGVRFSRTINLANIAAATASIWPYYIYLQFDCTIQSTLTNCDYSYSPYFMLVKSYSASYSLPTTNVDYAISCSTDATPSRCQSTLRTASQELLCRYCDKNNNLQASFSCTNCAASATASFRLVQMGYCYYSITNHYYGWCPNGAWASVAVEASATVQSSFDIRSNIDLALNWTSTRTLVNSVALPSLGLSVNVLGVTIAAGFYIGMDMTTRIDAAANANLRLTANPSNQYLVAFGYDGFRNIQPYLRVSPSSLSGNNNSPVLVFNAAGSVNASVSLFPRLDLGVDGIGGAFVSAELYLRSNFRAQYPAFSAISSGRVDQSSLYPFNSAVCSNRHYAEFNTYIGYKNIRAGYQLNFVLPSRISDYLSSFDKQTSPVETQLADNSELSLLSGCLFDSSSSSDLNIPLKTASSFSDTDLSLFLYNLRKEIANKVSCSISRLQLVTRDTVTLSGRLVKSIDLTVLSASSQSETSSATVLANIQRIQSAQSDEALSLICVGASCTSGSGGATGGQSAGGSTENNSGKVESGSESGGSNSKIIIIAAAGGAVLLLIALIVWYRYRKSSKAKRDATTNATTTTSASATASASASATVHGHPGPGPGPAALPPPIMPNVAVVATQSPAIDIRTLDGSALEVNSVEMTAV